MKNRIRGIIAKSLMVMVLITVLGTVAVAGNTRSKFDGYPYESSIMLDMVVDYGTRTDGQPVYIGYRMPGVDEAVAGWFIQKFIYDASDNFLRKVAAGSENSFDKVWDNRATYTYDEN